MMKFYTHVLILFMVHSVGLQAADQKVNLFELQAELMKAIRDENPKEVARLLYHPDMTINFAGTIAAGAMQCSDNPAIQSMSRDVCNYEQKRANPNQGLWAAIEVDDDDAVRVARWIGYDANVNEQKSLQDLRTPLHVAIQRNHVDVVKLLLEHGADQNKCCGSRGLYPVHQAILDRKQDIFEILLKSGADIDAADAQGRTAAHYAVIYSFNRKIFQAVLNQGADIDQKDTQGRRPEHCATGFGGLNKHQEESLLANVADLLRIKGDMTNVDNQGKTALYLHTYVDGDATQSKMKALLFGSVARAGLTGSPL